VPEAAFGAIALPLGGLARTWQHRADEPMQPGSTMKVLTSIVALERLGPGLRGRTELLATGPLEGDVLRGDLVLRGGADVEFGWPQLLGLLAELRDQGVREIAGDLLLDRTLFQPTRADAGVPDFDDAPEWPYNVIPDALNLAGSLLGIELRADGSTLQVRSQPALQGLDFDTRGMALVDARCADWDDTWSARPARGGRARGGGAARVLPAPLHGARGAAAHGPRPPGGTGRGHAVEPAGRQLARQRARGAHAGRCAAAGAARVPPLGEILRGMNKRSDNAQTRLLYQLPGRARGRRRRTHAHPGAGRRGGARPGSTSRASATRAWCWTTARACRAASASARASSRARCRRRWPGGTRASCSRACRWPAWTARCATA
jgi:D-alanyl-D-alanine carboxypeptidase/D-alanyl-D-alanine-endopeptidase (penicillin-binding protein 4)